jgi:hypothetical protein
MLRVVDDQKTPRCKDEKRYRHKQDEDQSDFGHWGLNPGGSPKMEEEYGCWSATCFTDARAGLSYGF